MYVVWFVGVDMLPRTLVDRSTAVQCFAYGGRQTSRAWPQNCVGILIWVCSSLIATMVRIDQHLVTRKPVCSFSDRLPRVCAFSDLHANTTRSPALLQGKSTKNACIHTRQRRQPVLRAGDMVWSQISATCQHAQAAAGQVHAVLYHQNALCNAVGCTDHSSGSPTCPFSARLSVPDAVKA
jgi:hypothetical protein